jgi:Helicase
MDAEVVRFARFAKACGLTLEGFQATIMEAVLSPPREVVVSQPRGQGKTTLLGVTMTYLLAKDPSMTIVCAASARDQAQHAFRAAERAAKRLPALEQGWTFTRREIRTREGGMLSVVSDARLGIGWGMETRYTHDWQGQRPEWAAQHWKDAKPMLAHMLFNGSMVSRVHYTDIDYGAGRHGVLPWPAKKFEKGPAYPFDVLPGGWDTSRWEVEFARLLNDLEGNDDFPFEDELHGFGLKIAPVSPLELTRPGGPRADD